MYFNISLILALCLTQFLACYLLYLLFKLETNIMIFTTYWILYLNYNSTSYLNNSFRKYLLLPYQVRIYYTLLYDRLKGLTDQVLPQQSKDLWCGRGGKLSCYSIQTEPTNRRWYQFLELKLLGHKIQTYETFNYPPRPILNG